MMKKNYYPLNFFKAILTGCLMLMLVQCELGGGTDVDNASLEGTVMIGGEVAAFADLYLMSKDYNPMKPNENPSFHTKSDENGYFGFTNIKRDIYALEVGYKTKGYMDWMGNLDLLKTGNAYYDLELKPMHTLRFSVPDSLQDSSLYIYIPGCLAMGSLKESENLTEIFISRVPETPIWAVYYGFEDRPDWEPRPFYMDIPIPASDTVDLRN